MPAKRLSILLLCDDEPGNASTILDHINAFGRYSRHQVKRFNPRGMPRIAALDLNEFDVVVIHYSLVLINDSYVSSDFREKLRRFRGLKVQFLQDEYRWVDAMTAVGRDIGIHVLFTVVPEPAAGQLYDSRLPGVRRVLTLTGFVPENVRERPIRPLRLRPIDVGYRGRDLPWWLGRLAYEKQDIARQFRERAPAYGLRTDIGWLEKDRIYGHRWVEFVESSRATLGTESGASIADFDGSVERVTRKHLAATPGATFEEVHEAVLRPYEGNVRINVVSPRVFEAAALGTVLVMYPGEYSGVVSPGQHYLVLEKDFSNMDEVAAKLRDDAFMSALADRAHDHLVRSGRWSYETFVKEFDEVVAEEAVTARGPSLAPRHRVAGGERWLRVQRARLLRGAARLRRSSAHLS